ncbi:hypothetical protein [Chachezhania antarctica]|uniref:hypothetical protein n=1 Tax=Chachezhania antarctica TaxID=2340860 RepID=UPI000EB15660|nr:hypothetical protein [Chachezhania antarctica]|tara:strand:- start:2972 stop:3277 length:306 start_codon:yes stop_codon:yes gene_type:complete
MHVTIRAACAVALLGLSGLAAGPADAQNAADCSSYAREATAGGALRGAARGAVRGDVVGAIAHTPGSRGRGARFGAVAGGTRGGLRGRAVGNAVYGTCMTD